MGGTENVTYMLRPSTPHLFVAGGQTFHSHRSGGGQTFFTHSKEGAHTFLQIVGRGDKHLSLKGWTTIFTSRGDKLLTHEGGRQIFYVGGCGGYDDVNGEINVSKQTFL